MIGYKTRLNIIMIAIMFVITAVCGIIVLKYS